MTDNERNNDVSVIQPESVEWTGENPCIWLKDGANEAYDTLVTFFRVRHSPYGAGQVAYVFLDPHGTADDGRPNICLSDSPELAVYLTSNFVSRFSVFRGLKALEELEYVKADEFTHQGDGRTYWCERGHGGGFDVHLGWYGLTSPYRAVIPPDQSPTGHQITAVYLEATDARVRVNGHLGAGLPATRDFFGREASTAFLAFSETWAVSDSPTEVT